MISAMIEVFHRHLSKNKYELEQEVMIKRLMELAGDLGLPLSPSQLTRDASAAPLKKTAEEEAPARSTVQRNKSPKSWAAVTSAAATSQARDAGEDAPETRPPVERGGDEVPAPAPVLAIPGPSRHAVDQSTPKAAIDSQQQNDDSVSVAPTAAADTAVDDEPEPLTPEPSHSVSSKEKERVQKRAKTIEPAAEMANGGSHVSKGRRPKADSPDAVASAAPAASPDTDETVNPGKSASSALPQVHAEGSAALQPKLPKPKPIPGGAETGATRPRSSSSTTSEVGRAASAHASVEASLDATSSSLTDQIMAEAMAEAMADARTASPAPEIIVHGPADI
jgi:hypothetical protein